MTLHEAGAAGRVFGTVVQTGFLFPSLKAPPSPYSHLETSRLYKSPGRECEKAALGSAYDTPVLDNGQIQPRVGSHFQPLSASLRVAEPLSPLPAALPLATHPPQAVLPLSKG